MFSQQAPQPTRRVPRNTSRRTLPRESKKWTFAKVDQFVADKPLAVVVQVDTATCPHCQKLLQDLRNIPSGTGGGWKSDDLMLILEPSQVDQRDELAQIPHVPYVRVFMNGEEVAVGNADLVKGLRALKPTGDWSNTPGPRPARRNATQPWGLQDMRNFAGEKPLAAVAAVATRWCPHCVNLQKELYDVDEKKNRWFSDEALQILEEEQVNTRGEPGLIQGWPQVRVWIGGEEFNGGRDMVTGIRGLQWLE